MSGAEIDVDTSAKTVTVEHDERVRREELVAALDRAGFPASRDFASRERS